MRPLSLQLLLCLVARANSPAASGMPLSSDASGLVATDRSDVDAPGDVGLRLDLSYVRNPLRIPVDVRFPHVIPNQVGLRAALDVGLWKHLEAGLWIPVTLDSYSNAGQFLLPGAAGNSTQYDVGAGDLRLFLKVNAVKGKTLGLAILGAAVLQSGDQQSFRSDGWGGDLRLVLDVSWRWLVVAFNVGARLHDTLTTRDPVGVALLQIGSELTWAAAFSAQVHDRVSLGLEFAGSESLAPAFDSRARTAEVLLSSRVRAAAGLSLYLGLGRALDPEAARGDDVRALFGLVWHPGGHAAQVHESDRDGDGIPDEKDQCPREPEDLDGWKDDDGCPDPDNDDDGIPDVKDQCPNEPEDRDGFQDSDGCPDADNDGDGIPDNEDWCPNAPGPTDNEGCPDNTPPEKKTPPKKLSVDLPAVLFARNQTALDHAGLTAVGRMADWLGFHKEVKRVRLEGHATADEKQGDALSSQRAQAVLQALAHRGVDPERLSAVGYGSRRPASARVEENRRVECIVVDLPEAAP